MALVLDATIGGAASNSYATVAEATAYHEAHVEQAVWEAATTAQKERALVMATRLLDVHVGWFGYPATTTQRLAWPRGGVQYVTGAYVAWTILPDGLKWATAELARLLLAGDLTAASDTAGISALKVGSIAVDFDGTLPSTDVIPESVWMFLRPWGQKLSGRAPISVPLVRA